MFVVGPALAGGTGAYYLPAQDTWVRLPDAWNFPDRYGPTAVWTGREILVWGKADRRDADGFEVVGLRYRPDTHTWAPISAEGAPSPREGHSAVWTGTEMIVWGGCCDAAVRFVSQSFGDGARYNPASDSWSPISTQGAPSPRRDHVAVWTGREMIVWDGIPSAGDGARYDPATDTWRPMPYDAPHAPSATLPDYAMVWTGREVILWRDGGARYDPATDTWSPLPTAGAPVPRDQPRAVWTGKEMLVWGGVSLPTRPGEQMGLISDGARYRPP
jgi:hypothetical protein